MGDVMKLYWKRRDEGWGNAKGYNNMADSFYRAVTEDLGFKLEPNAFHADICLHLAVPTTFEPVPGKVNVLLTMYEMDSIPNSWIPMIQRADMLIVPCHQNVGIFKKHFKGPVVSCPLGVDPEVFTFKQRVKPTEKEMFNFLWVGATNPRKGYELVLHAWDLWFRSMPPEIVDRTQLILKTQRGNEEGEIKRLRIRPPNLPKSVPVSSNVILDTRRVPIEELVHIYHGCHAFMLPSFGEGWGLTLCEAQATGLPCIFTPWSGPKEFMKDSWSYPVRYRMAEQKAVIPKPDGTQIIDHAGLAAVADPNHIARRMFEIFDKYDLALKKGLAGSNHIHKNFTWTQAGEKLLNILEKYNSERMAA
jgi:glycosyltransferase involved in cell wall biosynthesis